MHIGEEGPVRYCLVKDYSDGGVRINTNGFKFPDEFVLRFPSDDNGHNGTYRVMWRVGQDIGARLVNEDSELRQSSPRQA